MAVISVLTNVGTEIRCECGTESHQFIADKINTTVKINTLGVWTITAELAGKIMTKKAIVDDKHIDYIVELYNLDKPDQNITTDDLDELLKIINTLNTQVKTNGNQIDDLKNKIKNLTDSNNNLQVRQQRLDAQLKDLEEIIDAMKGISSDVINGLKETIDNICIDINEINGTIDDIKESINNLPEALTEEEINNIINTNNNIIMKTIADTFEGISN